jgi:hypothetical protein
LDAKITNHFLGEFLCISLSITNMNNLSWLIQAWTKVNVFPSFSRSTTVCYELSIDECVPLNPLHDSTELHQQLVLGAEIG